MMIEDKKIKEEILKELLKSMGDRVAKNDLSPLHEGKKTKMIIKAEGSSPEVVKEEVIKKLGSLPVGEEESESEDLAEGGEENCEECGGEGCPECEGDPEVMDEMSGGMKQMMMDMIKNKKMKK